MPRTINLTTEQRKALLDHLNGLPHFAPRSWQKSATYSSRCGKLDCAASRS
jgi:hypothetical protein